MISQRNLFLNYLAQTSDAPIAIEPKSANGLVIKDVNGKEYIDLISGIGVSNLGHRYPRVVEAIKEQVDKYLHVMVYGEFVQSPQNELAKDLVSLLPSNMEQVYLVNSGSEAVEGAMKLAKKYTGRSEFVAMKDCYHGNTQSVMSLMDDEERKAGYGPYTPVVKHMAFDTPEDFDKITRDTAAVIVETVMGEAGCKVHSTNYLKELKRKCREVGALLIFDEVQCGLGRTGKMFAFEHSGVEPDVIILAKGLGGGMPIGAFVSSKEIMEVFVSNPVLGHITTFGGHPVSSAAASATVKVLKEENYISEIAEKEALFRSLLVHPLIQEVSGTGLMMAIKLKDFEMVEKVMGHCLENGIIIDWFLFATGSLRIAPPLIIDKETIRFACETIIGALDEIT